MDYQANREIIKSLMEIPKPTKRDLDKAKLKVADERNLSSLTPNSELIFCLKPDERKKLLPVLRRKNTRSISGVTIIAVMSKPLPCPHKMPCVYCPGGPKFGVPQSYTGYEPAAMRGIENSFDPYRQVRSRMNQLESIGHEPDKIELVIMGGTFPSTPIDYQRDFIKGCLDAIIGTRTNSLAEAKRIAESSNVSNVGITFETRPDWAKKEQIDLMLTMGVTRVELGVQNIYDSIYKLVGRGHTVEDVREATRTLKDSGLKVCYHLMPGLPGSNFKKDLEAFHRIFSCMDFKPDMIKVYPCLVLEGTRLWDWWKKGEYTPYSTEEAVDLLVEVKKMVPPWVRIMRIQRDIPAYLVKAGVKKSNLRQLVLKKLKEENGKCRCIRCREVGHRWLKENLKPESVKIITIKERASEGIDVFISLEDSINDIILGCLRLRIPSEKTHRPEIKKESTSIVRELHVYGRLVPVGKRAKRQAWQHRGYGTKLLQEAERVSREEYDTNKILVNSGIGAKSYYKRHGYDYDGPFMSKRLDG